jgi:hypothetical protein
MKVLVKRRSEATGMDDGMITHTLPHEYTEERVNHIIV